MTWYARSYSRSVIPFPVTFQQDVTLSEHLQLAADKKVKYGTTGAAHYLAVSGQTEGHLTTSLPTANGMAIIDKDREAVDRGAIGDGGPTVALFADSASALQSHWSQVAGDVKWRNGSGVMDITPAGNLNIGSGTGKIGLSVAVKLKQYATASLPAFVAGDLVFDSTINKAKVGGAAAWEAITSV